MPTHPAPREIRPWSSADIATLKPPPISPSTASAPTRTPSRWSSAVSCARRPSLPLIGRASNPVRARRDDEAGDPARPLFAGSCEHERPRRPRAERDEHLLAAEDEPVAVALGARLERAGIRPGAGLGERVTAELLTCREWRQQAPALLVGAPPGDRLPVQAVRDRDDPPHVRVGSPELLDEERVRDHVQAEPAVLLGQRGGEEAQRGQLADDPAVDRLGAIPLGGVRSDLGVAERPRRLTDQLLLVGELEVHAARLDQKKSRRVGGAFVHPTDWPLRAREPLAVTWRGFDLLALRTRRDPQSTSRERLVRKGARSTKSPLVPRFTRRRSSVRSAST